MKNIEVETKTFISKEQHGSLIDFFTKNGTFLGDDEQMTYYFDSEYHLRIQKNKTYSKVCMKKGGIHDEQREEMEIRLPVEEFEKLEQLFTNLGYRVIIKWFRTRHSFKWQNIEVAVDYTKGYGYILELEQMADEQHKEGVLQFLKQKLTELGIAETPKDEFDQKYKYYKENWEELVNNG